jgi:hypothetical protein
MAVKLSALCTGRSTPQKLYFSASGTYYCWWLSEPQGLVRLEGLGKLKNSFTSSGLEPATFRSPSEKDKCKRGEIITENNVKGESKGRETKQDGRIDER